MGKAHFSFQLGGAQLKIRSPHGCGDGDVGAPSSSLPPCGLSLQSIPDSTMGLHPRHLIRCDHFRNAPPPDTILGSSLHPNPSIIYPFMGEGFGA